MKQFDMSDYHKGLKRLREFPVGKTFYIIKDNKIKPVLIRTGTFIYTDPKPDKKDTTELEVAVRIEGRVDGNVRVLNLHELYETREQAAEDFLDRNEIPKKLLQVLNIPKSRTTIGDLIDKLQIVDPEIDLGDSFWKILKPITQRIENPDVQTTDEYWDCECEHNYIHPAAHTWCHKCKAHKEEMPSSRVEEVLEGKEMFFTEDSDEDNTDDE